LSTTTLDVAVAVPVSNDADAQRAIRQFVVPDGTTALLFLLDISLAGSVSEPSTGTRVRGASFTMGDALSALAEITGKTPVILRRADAAYDSAQLPAVVDAFRENPEAAFLTSNVGLAGADGIKHVIDPARDGDRPPQCWDAGLAIRGSSVGTVTGAAWFPSVLSTYLTAHATGRTHSLGPAYAVVSQDTFAAERFPHYADLHLLHAHAEPFGLDVPWLSVVFPCSGPLSGVADTLESLFGQVLPPGTYEVVAVDRGRGPRPPSWAHSPTDSHVRPSTHLGPAWAQLCKPAWTPPAARSCSSLVKEAWASRTWSSNTFAHTATGQDSSLW